MEIKIDGFTIDITQISKKITYQTIDGQIVITYDLNFPPYTQVKKFKTDKQAQKYINEIKKDGDTVRYI